MLRAAYQARRLCPCMWCNFTTPSWLLKLKSRRRWRVMYYFQCSGPTLVTTHVQFIFAFYVPILTAMFCSVLSTFILNGNKLATTATVLFLMQKYLTGVCSTFANVCLSILQVMCYVHNWKWNTIFKPQQILNWSFLALSQCKYVSTVYSVLSQAPVKKKFTGFFGKRCLQMQFK